MAAARLSYDELLDLVAQQATQIGCLQQTLAQLVSDNQREVESLKERNAELEKQLQEAHRQAAAFRRRKSMKKPEDEKKRPGREKGHAPAFRPSPKVDESIEVKLAGCPHCQGELTHLTRCVQLIEEIPEVRPICYEVTTWQAHCQSCGEVRSTHPLQTSTATGAAGTHLGPRAQAVALSLAHRSGLTMRRNCEVLESLCGVKLTAGGLAQLIQRAAKRMASQYEDIKLTLRNGPAVFADETSWYVSEPGWWLWVFTSPTATLYRVEKSRGSDIVIDTLTNDYQGTLVSDCLATYNPIQCRKHKCIAHHLRALSEHQEELAKRRIESHYLMLWKVLLQNVIDTWKVRSKSAEVDYALKVLQLQRGVDNLLNKSPEHPEEIKFRNRLERQKAHLLGCLAEPAAEPTNNRAERDLRPAVISRKLSCGNKTKAGKEAWEVLRSIAVTTVNRGLDLISTFSDCVRLSSHIAQVR